MKQNYNLKIKHGYLKGEYEVHFTWLVITSGVNCEKYFINCSIIAHGKGVFAGSSFYNQLAGDKYSQEFGNKLAFKRAVQAMAQSVFGVTPEMIKEADRLFRSALYFETQKEEK